jgi:hypothetical protein
MGVDSFSKDENYILAHKNEFLLLIKMAAIIWIWNVLQRLMC